MIPFLRYLGLAVPFKAPLDKLDRLQSVRKAFFDIFQLSLLFDFLSTLTNWPILNFKKSAKDFINLGNYIIQNFGKEVIGMQCSFNTFNII